MKYLVLVVLVAKISAGGAGFVPPAEWCLPDSGLKELSGCIEWTDLRDECSSKGTEEKRLECFCTQQYLSSLYACESDIQLCLASHMFDNQFDEKVSQWHSTCDSRTSATVTTPALPTITNPYDFGACSRLYQSCLSADHETNLCSEKYLPTASKSYISCACQPPVYSLFSECQYNGNISCKRTAATESNILGYSVCSYFWSGSETLTSIDWTSELRNPDAAALQATQMLVETIDTSLQPTVTATSVSAPNLVSTAIPESTISDRAGKGELRRRQYNFENWFADLNAGLF